MKILTFTFVVRVKFIVQSKIYIQNFLNFYKLENLLNSTTRKNEIFIYYNAYHLERQFLGLA